MVHIFKGVHEYRKDYFCYISSLSLRDVISIEDLHKLLANNKILPHALIRSVCEKTEWVEFSRTNLIEQRLSTGDKIMIGDKELFAKEVIQCDNGDVIVHVGDNTFYDGIRSDYILESTRDTDSYIKAKEIMDEYKRIIEKEKNKKPEKQEQKEVIPKNKWWQFWR
jgi:hypothetical protein